MSLYYQPHAPGGSVRHERFILATSGDVKQQFDEDMVELFQRIVTS